MITQRYYIKNKLIKVKLLTGNRKNMKSYTRVYSACSAFVVSALC